MNKNIFNFVLIVLWMSLSMHSFANASASTQKERNQITNIYNKLIKKTKEFTSDTPVQVQVNPHIRITVVDLEESHHSEIIKGFLEQELKNVNLKKKLQEQDRIASKSKWVRVLHQLKPSNLYEKHRTRLTITRFAVTGVLSGFSVFVVNPYSPFVLIGAVSGSVAGLLQYNNSHVLDFLEHPLQFNKNKNKIWKLGFNKYWKSSELKHYIKTFIIGALYLGSVTSIVNFLGQTSIFTNQDLINIFTISTLGAIFIGSMHKMNLKMRAHDYEELGKHVLKDMENDKNLIHSTLSSVKNKIQEWDKLTETDFAQLKQDLTTITTNPEKSLIDKVFKHDKISLKSKELILKTIVQNKISQTNYGQLYDNVRNSADIRTVFATSSITSASLVAVVQAYPTVFLGLNLIELGILISGPAILTMYNYYHRLKQSYSFLDLYGVENVRPSVIKNKVLKPLVKSCKELFSLSKK